MSNKTHRAPLRYNIPDFFSSLLGFKHVCGTDRGGKFALVRVPCDKSRRKFLAKSKKWLSKHRHWKRRGNQKKHPMTLHPPFPLFTFPPPPTNHHKTPTAVHSSQ